MVTGGVGGTVYVEYFSGQQLIESIDNDGNDNPSEYPPIYNSMSGDLEMCDAANKCANLANPQVDDDQNVYLSFDLHYLQSNGTWECVLYYDPNTDARAFNVSEPDATFAFGYSQPP